MMSSECKRFPCLEHPLRCYFSECSSDEKRRLACRRNGRVVLTSGSRTVYEEFQVLVLNDDADTTTVMIRSSKFPERHMRVSGCRTFLCLEAMVEDAGTTEKDYHFQLKKVDASRFQIVAGTPTSNGSPQCYLSSNTRTDGTVLLNHDGPANSWEMEFLSGELLFFTCQKQQIRCDMFGRVSMTDNSQGWEVWRCVEAGKGNIRLVSWMHNRLICCEESNSVSTTAEPCFGTLWEITKTQPDRGNGVCIHSIDYPGRFLCTEAAEEMDFPKLSTTHDSALCTSDWQLEAAHKQTYCLRTGTISVGPFPYVTTNKRQNDEFVVTIQADETVTLFCSKEQQFLGLADSNDLLLTDEPFTWSLGVNTDGTYTFQTDDRFLCLTDDQIPADASTNTFQKLHIAENVACSWCLDPVMPRAVSSSKIRTFTIGTTIAVATTVAMPFAVAGVAGLIGTEMGILANAVAVTLTGAEALASVGVIGTTAALCFRTPANSLAAAVDDIAVTTKNKRPFCDWRLW